MIIADDERRFGIIVEWKTEQPLIFEGTLLTYEEADARMKVFAADPKVIRVAVFAAHFAYGNASMLPPTTQTEKMGG